MPEVSDPTHLSEYDKRDNKTKFCYIREKKFFTEMIIERSSMISAKRNLLPKGSESYLVRWEGAAEGGANDWGEVVTR